LNQIGISLSINPNLLRLMVVITLNVLQLPTVGDFWHYFSNISLNFLLEQIFNKPQNLQLRVGAVMPSANVG